MACDICRHRVDLYVDGELSPAEAAELAAHLRRCSECARDVLGRVQLKRSVHLAGKRFQPSAEFRSKIGKAVSGKARPSFHWRWVATAVALIALFATLAVTSYFRTQRLAHQRVYSELADLHVSTLASATPVDVISSDRHTVKPWFQGKIPFTFNLPELQGSPFTLVGGRVAYLEQSAGAQLIYQVRQHKISVFIFPERGTEAPRFPSGVTNRLSFNTETWSQNGLRYFVIGDTNANDIHALSDLIRSAG